MAIFRRLLILGAAGAGAAWFMKQQRESGEEPVFGDGGATASGGTATATDIGDDAAAGTGPSETLQEQGTPEPQPPAAEAETSPAEDDTPATGAVAPTPDATLARDIPTPSQPTRVGNAVIPDMSPDPLVREQENAAAAEAGAIGGEPETPQSSGDVGLAQDPAMQPVVEASGDEHETLEEADRELGGNRERQGADRDLGAE